MTHFFKESVSIDVSRITKNGWWQGNTVEHVSKGTALGEDFTQNLYTPSKNGMIARYDRERDTWSNEIEDMTSKQYFNEQGQQFLVGKPDGQYPEWAILECPPEHNTDTHTVLYQDGKWTIFEIQIGKLFYGEFGDEFIVSDYNFELPGNHSWIAPPVPQEGYAIKLVDGQWVELIDHRGEIAFKKNRDDFDIEDYEIHELGDLPVTHTLTEPQSFDSWSEDLGWVYDIERHRPYKALEEKQWRDEQLTFVLNRIDQYEKDQNYPVELRTSPIKDESQYNQLLLMRKQLCGYPDSSGYPFDERPMVEI